MKLHFPDDNNIHQTKYRLSMLQIETTFLVHSSYKQL